MRRSLIAVLLTALVLSACGDDDAVDTVESSTTAATAPTELTPAMDDPVLDKITVAPPVAEDGEPVVTVDGEVSVDKTVRRVLSEGDGDVAADGSTATIHLVGVNGRTGERFDGTRPGEPASVSLDPAGVLPGIYRSLIGVPAGSQVVAAISPSEGFGDQGFADLDIGADDSVIFVFDVIGVTTPLERATGTPVEPPADLPTVTLADDGEPTIELPESDPPTELIEQVLIEGDGPVVEAGQSLTVHYTGIIWPGGEQFDSSWASGSPASFDIGVGAVIPGWDETLVGQTVGSQLVLVIPPEDGYGTEGNPSAGITSTDTLVFVVDILAAT